MKMLTGRVASNMSGITTTQSRIAEDLDAFDSANWFTSAYLIATSSMSPIVARLAQIFSPRICIFISAILFAIGGLVTSQATSLHGFLVGRVISGVAGAGIMTISFILVLELTGKKRRGLFIGLVNTCFTIGVSLGAVIAGGLLDVTGWVCPTFLQIRSTNHQLTFLRRDFCSGYKVHWQFLLELVSTSASPHRLPLVIKRLKYLQFPRNLPR